MAKSKPAHSAKGASASKKVKSGAQAAAAAGQAKPKAPKAGNKRGNKLRDRAELDRLDTEGLGQVRLNANKAIRESRKVSEKKSVVAKVSNETVRRRYNCVLIYMAT